MKTTRVPCSSVIPCILIQQMSFGMPISFLNAVLSGGKRSHKPQQIRTKEISKLAGIVE